MQHSTGGSAASQTPRAPSKFKKDYYGGALMVIVGVAAAYTGYGYRVGELAHMGPGFFPVALGTLLAFIGVLMVISARGQEPSPEPAVSHGHPGGMPDMRGCVCIVLGILAFLLLGEYGGLLPATFAIVFISALGDRDNTLLEALLLSLAMVVIAVVVFWWALSLQLPLFQWGG